MRVPVKQHLICPGFGIVFPEFMVKTTSRFYNMSGVEVSASLSGIKIQKGSLETIVAAGVLSGLSVSTELLECLLAGGIALATSNNDSMENRVMEGHRFTLYGEAEDSWLQWSPEIVSEQSGRKKKK